MILSLIAAMASNRVIGNKGDIPWEIPGEQKMFKKITLGHTVIMGRKTYESLGKPLPGRTNIVISRNPAYQAEGIKVVASLEEALALAEDIALIDGCDELMVIGGAQIYAEAMDRADRIYLTRVHCHPEGDAYLPAIDTAHWRECHREECVAAAGDDHDYSLLVYERA